MRYNSSQHFHPRTTIKFPYFLFDWTDAKGDSVKRSSVKKVTILFRGEKLLDKTATRGQWRAPLAAMRSSLLGDFYVTRGCETGEIFTARRVIRGKSVVVPRESWRQRMQVYDPRCLTRANAPGPRLHARVVASFSFHLAPVRSVHPSSTLRKRCILSRSIRHCGNIPRDDRATKIQIYYSIDISNFWGGGGSERWSEVFFSFFLRSNSEINFLEIAREERIFIEENVPPMFIEW